MSKTNDIMKKAALVTAMGLSAYGSGYAAEKADNGSLTGKNLEAKSENQSNVVEDLITKFQNLSSVKFESKDDVNFHGQKMHTDEWSNRYGSLTHFAYEDGSKETRFFCQDCHLIERGGKFFDHNDKQISTGEALKQLKNFEKNTQAPEDMNVFMKTLKEQSAQGR